MMSWRARPSPGGLTPERPGESNLLGTRVLGPPLVVFARVAGSLLGPRRHLACSEGKRGAGDGSKPLRGRVTVTSPAASPEPACPMSNPPPPPEMPPQIPVQ